MQAKPLKTITKNIILRNEWRFSKREGIKKYNYKNIQNLFWVMILQTKMLYTIKKINCSTSFVHIGKNINEGTDKTLLYSRL
jgi:hypothetical protein